MGSKLALAREWIVGDELAAGGFGRVYLVASANAVQHCVLPPRRRLALPMRSVWAGRALALAATQDTSRLRQPPSGSIQLSTVSGKRRNAGQTLAASHFVFDFTSFPESVLPR